MQSSQEICCNDRLEIQRAWVALNLLDRQFSVSTLDTVYVSDITYLKVGRKWHYLAVFIDLFSRMVVGWDLSDSLERFSIIRTLAGLFELGSKNLFELFALLSKRFW